MFEKKKTSNMAIEESMSVDIITSSQPLVYQNYIDMATHSSCITISCFPRSPKQQIKKGFRAPSFGAPDGFLQQIKRHKKEEISTEPN
jgi:hypothetical protein